jgi:arginyl-tRNA synthetase
MVTLPEGKMKSREGTVVDADNLLSELRGLALEEMKNKERDSDPDDMEGTAEKIALAAVHYFLLSVSPKKDMIFNPAESLSFNGNTGPYLQYMTTRIHSIFRKAEERGLNGYKDIDSGDKLGLPEEWEILTLLADFPGRVEAAAKELNPGLIAAYCYDLARAFSRYYHDHSVINNEDTEVSLIRLRLTAAVLQVLNNAFGLINIPALDKM